MFDGRTDRAPQARHRLRFPELRIKLIDLPYLAIGPPTQIAVTCVAQIRVCDLGEATCRVEARSELVGECLIVDKAVGARRADRVFVKLLGVKLSAFYSCDLCAHECRAVFEILRTMFLPDLELPVVSGQ